MDEQTRRKLQTIFETKHLLPRPDPGTYAEPLLAVLRLGYVVVVTGDTSNPLEDSFGGALAQIRDLGWPLNPIPFMDRDGRPRGDVAYTLKHPFIPGWTWAEPAPVIGMSVC